MNTMDFFVGTLVGAGLGVGITLAVARLRRWLGYSEAGRLTAENRELKRRLAAKDRHIGRMLTETERLADKLGEKAIHLKEHIKLIEGDATLHLNQEEPK